jgi:hypothetical protein
VCEAGQIESERIRELITLRPACDFRIWTSDRKVNPHLFAALAFVHAQRATGAGIQKFVSQPWHCVAALAPDFVGGLE